jgi:hypothetical protein
MLSYCPLIKYNFTFVLILYSWNQRDFPATGWWPVFADAFWKALLCSFCRLPFHILSCFNWTVFIQSTQHTLPVAFPRFRIGLILEERFPLNSTSTVATSDVYMCTEGTRYGIYTTRETWRINFTVAGIWAHFLQQALFHGILWSGSTKTREWIKLGWHYSSLVKRSKVPFNHLCTVRCVT